MQNEIKILMIDDDEEDFIIVKDLLIEIGSNRYVIDWTPSYKEGLKLILEKRHDVFLVDYRLGADNGLELIREAFKNGCVVPLILLTGQNDIEIDTQAMKVGVADYLVKGAISSSQLERTIRYSIAEAKNLAEIKQLNADLEKKVQVRTLELTNALEREKANNEMKSRFVSFASHEFRTPLSAILSSSSLIELYNKPEQEEQRLKHINRISSSVKHLTEILNDFLTHGELEQKNIEVKNSLFNLPEFIKIVIEDMSGMVNGKKQHIIYDHDGEVMIKQSSKILKNILLNLLSNASKYSPIEKDILISSSVSNDRVSITVKDHGIGIPEEDQTKLFSQFFRASNVENIQGTGLGLAIVKKYVELLDGTINFISQPNKGTTFTIEFLQNNMS